MAPALNETDDVNGFNGLAVAAFESRMAKEMEDLIVRHSGVPKVTLHQGNPPFRKQAGASNFFENPLQQGNIDLVIFMTGVGTRTLFQALESHYAPSRIQKAFKHASLVARGPKSVKALTEKNMRTSVVVPEPNTWREVMEALEGQRPVKGLKVAVQEYVDPNPEFLQALLENGAKEVTSVPVYRWALPEDTRPLTGLIESILDGEVPIALFTSAQQIRNVFEVADGLKKTRNCARPSAAW